VKKLFVRETDRRESAAQLGSPVDDKVIWTEAHTAAPMAAVAPLGSLQGPPSVSATQIDAVLASYDSPATGTGATWIALGQQYGIDPAYALAFFIHESSAGTAPGWAGLKPDGSTTHNIGNVICAGYPTCYGRFRDYGGWREGIEDWFRLLSNEYFPKGLTTVESIIPVYAPASDNNNEAAYIHSVNEMVASWHTANQ
jgi:hypothetical protein